MDLKCLALILVVCVIVASGQRSNPGQCEHASIIRCLRNPCSPRSRCPNYPEAVCVNDDPCNPYCVGHFYDGDRQLSRRDCRPINRRRFRNGIRMN